MKKLLLFACGLLTAAALAGCSASNGQAETKPAQTEALPAREETQSAPEETQSAQAEAQSAPAEAEPARTEAQAASEEAAGTAQQNEAAVVLPGNRAYPMPDDYEIHLLMDPEKVLDENHELKPAVVEAFAAGKKKVKTYGLVYMETPQKTFHSEGWINRIRLRDDKPGKDVKFTYKKRYPIAGEDIQAALRLAASEGFDISDDSWDIQVEYGYEDLTLSLSMEKEGPELGLAHITDFAEEDAAAICEELMPALEKDWRTEGWGLDAIRASRMAGPVRFCRYTGTFQGEEVKLEIWTIPDRSTGKDSYITEISCEADSLEEAVYYRRELENALAGEGIFLPEDGLKTERILDAFQGD